MGRRAPECQSDARLYSARVRDLQLKATLHGFWFVGSRSEGMLSSCHGTEILRFLLTALAPHRREKHTGNHGNKMTNETADLIG